MKNEELEVNNGLPTGWAYAGLEDISDLDRHSIKRGPFGSALKKEFFVPDGYKVYEQGNVINNDFDRGTYFINDEKFEDLKSFSIKPKDILMSCAGTVGKLAIVPDGVQEGVINQALLKLSVHPDIDLQYFFKLLSYQIDEILKSNLRGSAMMNLTSVKDLKLVKFPIAPLNEQKRIVAKIEKLFSNLDNSDKYLLHLEKQLKRYRQSVLKSAFEGELTKEWREKNNIKFEWEFKKFYEIIKLIDGDRGKNYPKQTDYFNVGYCLYLSTKNVRPFGFNFDEQVYITQEKHEILRSGTLSVGDVVLTTRGTIGNVAYYDKTIPFPVVRINSGMLILRIMNDVKLTPSFLMKYIQSPSFDTQRKEKVSGTAQPQLPVGTLKDFNIPLPNTFEEQQEIVNQIEKHFSIIDKLETVVQQSIKESKRLRQSILKQAFEGKLVEQDSNDESASLLLKKIAKVKEEYQKAQKKQVRKK